MSNKADKDNNLPKKKYNVYYLEVWVQGYTILASSKEEARTHACSDGDPIVGSFEYSHTLDETDPECNECCETEYQRKE